jgi:hypothetical protein
LTLTILLVVVHFIILYFWIFDWRKLVTTISLVSWIGSAILGILFYIVYCRILDVKGRIVAIYQRILLGSALMTVILVVPALAIESITSSMP